jgi:hypothetical protein
VPWQPWLAAERRVKKRRKDRLKPGLQTPDPANFARMGRQFLSFCRLSSSPIPVEQWLCHTRISRINRNAMATSQDEFCDTTEWSSALREGSGSVFQGFQDVLCQGLVERVELSLAIKSSTIRRASAAFPDLFSKAALFI